MREDYAELQEAVERAGYFTTFQPIREPGDRLVCASHKYPEGPRSGHLHGNSFWVAKRVGEWFVVGWEPRFFRVSQPERLTELCLRLLEREPAKAYFSFDEGAQREFVLIEIDEAAFPTE